MKGGERKEKKRRGGNDGRRGEGIHMGTSLFPF